MGKKPLFFYGWVILAISFVAMVLSGGARNSFSVFYVVILGEFGWSRASTAGIFSINTLVYGTAAPFAGALVDRFGPKRVVLIGGTILVCGTILCSRANTIYDFYFFFGVLNAIGASLIGYAANAPVLSHWFFRRKGMTFGILNSGWGVSFFLMIPLVQWFMTKFGWRTSFVSLGILIGVIVLPLFALFSHHKPQDIGLLPDGIYLSEKAESTFIQHTAEMNKTWAHINWTLKKAMHTHQFWLIFLAVFCVFGVVQNLVVVHQIALMRDVGLSNAIAILIVALWGGMMVVGNLSGFISDKIGREKTFTLGCLASILGLVMLLLLEKTSHGWIAYLYALFLGLGMGMNGPVLGAALADMFQGKKFGSINGFVMLGFGLGGIVGPWVGGVMFDITKSYSGALILAILIMWIALALLWIAAPSKIRKPT